MMIGNLFNVIKFKILNNIILYFIEMYDYNLLLINNIVLSFVSYYKIIYLLIIDNFNNVLFLAF